ncbi:MAG: phosphate regulon sensor protein PhoR [Pseudomonadota bacterium]
MNWGRLFLRIFILVAATAAGEVVGVRLGVSVFGGLLGLSTVATLWALREEWRSARLIEWLRRDSDAPAPSLPGRWGDVAYHAEKALRVRERELAAAYADQAQFLQAFEATPNGVMLLDAAHHVVWCNRVAADHFGLDPERDRLQLITNLVRQPLFVDYLLSGDYEEPLLMGSPRHQGSLSILIRRYAADRYMVLLQDVSAREQADAMRREFVSHVSHEIRTPLTVLSGFVETLESLDLDRAERDRILGLMRQQSQRMQSLVSDLLVLARLEGSPRPPVDRWVELDGLLSSIEAEVRSVSGGLHQIIFPPRTHLALAGQETELHSAIGNLVLNAVRYTPRGGEIRVEALVNSDGHALITVQDSGIGIAREHIPRLTQRFYRVDPSRSRETGGTGLGLAIVKHAIQRHGGELLIDSELGRGSRFSLRVPSARVKQLEPSDGTPGSQSSARSAGEPAH